MTEDYNGERQEGFGPMEMTVWRRAAAGQPPTPISSRRCNAATWS